MDVVGIVGSPRKGMNTDALVQRALAGCRSAGAQTETVYLNDLDIAPCQACRVQDGTGCIYHDGMDALYEAFETADGLILGTPVYYNTVSSQMKLLIDRSYCLAERLVTPAGEVRYQTAVSKRKKALVVAVGGSGLNPECVLPVFELWAPEVNVHIVDALMVSEAQIGRPPMDSADVLERAFAKGVQLAKTLT